MGEYISMSDALIISGFSMATVFVVLIMISFLINGLKMIGTTENKMVKDEKKDLKQREESKEKITTNRDMEDVLEEELVAVIAAAVAANLGLNIPDIRIKNIKRVPQDMNPWVSSRR